MRKRYRKRYWRLLLTGLGVSLVCLGLTPAWASSANISHSYHTRSPVPNGSLVSLDSSQLDYIVPANTSNTDRLLGLAVATNDSLLAVDPSNSTTQVASSGTASALVSTLNGDINVGDQVAVSPFNGIGMKATLGSHIIGLAQTAFNGKSAGAITQRVTDNKGKVNIIKLGYVRVNIAVGIDSVAGGAQLGALQKLAKAITGHVVSNTRVIISIVVAVVAVTVLVVLIYASIYASIISVGRNPLAKYAVFRTLGSVLGMAALTALIALITIYLLLR